MTISEAKEKILLLIDENGSTQYDDKIYALMDLKQREIATLVKQIIKTHEIESFDGIITVTDDCYNIISVKADGNEYSYKQITDTTYEIQGISEDRTFEVQYHAYPKKITDTSTEFEVDQLSQDAIVYGVAAALVYDDPELYSFMIGEHDRIMANIANRATKATIFTPYRYYL